MPEVKVKITNVQEELNYYVTANESPGYRLKKTKEQILDNMIEFEHTEIERDYEDLDDFFLNFGIELPENITINDAFDILERYLNYVSDPDGDDWGTLTNDYSYDLTYHPDDNSYHCSIQRVERSHTPRQGYYRSTDNDKPRVKAIIGAILNREDKPELIEVI